MEDMNNNERGRLENMGSFPENINNELQMMAKTPLSEAEAKALLQQETQRVQGQLAPNHQKNKKLVVIVAVVVVLLVLIGVGFMMVMQTVAPKNVSVRDDGNSRMIPRYAV